MKLARGLVFSLATVLAACSGNPTKSSESANLRPDDVGEYTGCVRQLDANAGGFLQAIVHRDPHDQIAVHLEDPKLQALVETAFVWYRPIHLTYRGESPKTAIDVELDRAGTTQYCNFAASPEDPANRYCIVKLAASADGHGIDVSIRRGTQDLVVHTDDGTLQALLQTAFIWDQQAYVWYGEEHAVTRVKLDRYYTQACVTEPRLGTVR